MLKFLRKIFQLIFNKKEYKKLKRISRMPIELSSFEKNLICEIKESNLTMTSYERLCSTALACKHIIASNIKGDFVECGVRRGGNAILATAIFNFYKYPMKVYLFDTFQGMTKPTKEDKRASSGESALNRFKELERGNHNEWCYASLQDVKNNFKKFNLLKKNVQFVQGDVLKTLIISKNLPNKISILRLDTDWYESTKKELEVLYPKLNKGGVLLIDDYGFWAGSRKATDEYFMKCSNRPFLQYVDGSGRSAVKC